MKQLLIFIALSVVVLGQSPYNRLGYGTMDPVTEPLGSSLGTGAIALRDSARVTLHNPAALYGLDKVYFGVALSTDFTTSDAATTNITRLEQFSIALPLGQKVGLSLGANAVADFKSNYEALIAEGTLEEQSTGGLWDYQIGMGYSITPQLSAGLKLHMLRGTFRRELLLNMEDVSELYVLKGNLSGNCLELGLISQLGDKVSLGLTADIPYDMPFLSGNDSLAGTSKAQDYEEELAAWPTTIRLGVVYHYSKYKKLVAGLGQQIFVETGFDDALLFKLPEGWHTVPAASFQVALQQLAVDRHSRYALKRTGYQIGVSVKNHYLAPASEELIYEYALISGVNMGLRNGRSLFDISGEFGIRHGIEELPDELFGQVKFGIQVSDTWFKKVKRR